MPIFSIHSLSICHFQTPVIVAKYCDQGMVLTNGEFVVHLSSITFVNTGVTYQAFYFYQTLISAKTVYFNFTGMVGHITCRQLRPIYTVPCARDNSYFNFAPSKKRP